MKPATWILLTCALGACSAPDDAVDANARPPALASATSAPPNRALAGWYLEHDAEGRFQPCGPAEPLRVDSADLRARARDFGLDADTPVYVRVAGSIDGSTLQVVRVEQFGSPTPVRDCAMTGVVLPAEGDH